MEVVLRKTKITGSVLKQVQYATLEQMLKYKVLGWVSHGGFYKIILYDSNSNNISFTFLNAVFELDESWNPEHTEINYGAKCYNPKHIAQIYKCDSKEKANDILIKLKSLKRIANSDGQIFY